MLTEFRTTIAALGELSTTTKVALWYVPLYGSYFKTENCCIIKKPFALDSHILEWEAYKAVIREKIISYAPYKKKLRKMKKALKEGLKYL